MGIILRARAAMGLREEDRHAELLAVDRALAPQWDRVVTLDAAQANDGGQQ